MKTIIAGSRNITDHDFVQEIININVDFEITEVVSGGCRGIDKIGEYWAGSMGVPVKEFSADWDTHGKAAGPIRNRQMAEYAEALILIWDGKSRGSANMLKEAQNKNLIIMSFIYER